MSHCRFLLRRKVCRDQIQRIAHEEIEGEVVFFFIFKSIVLFLTVNCRFQGTFQELAISKHGSRALEKIFFASATEQKVKIMEELSNKSQILNSTMFGQVILTKLKVELYKKSFHNWKSAIEKEEKTKDIFKDILTKST